MMDILKKILTSKWAVIISLLFIGNMILQEYMFTKGSFSYRLTVRIDTPEGIKTGSGVWKVFMARGLAIKSLSYPSVGVAGDAIVIDLGKRGKVFALLKGYFIDADHLVFENFRRPGYPNGGGELTREGIRFYRSLKEGKVVLKPNYYPYLVRFKDFDDPQSIESVMGYTENPMPFANKLKSHNFIDINHFEEMFGVGVNIKDITMEITTDPITRSIEQWPEWLRVPMGKPLGNRDFSVNRLKDERYFTKYEFTRGF